MGIETRWWAAFVAPLALGCTVQADLGGVTSGIETELVLPIEVLGSGAPDERVVASVELAVAARDLRLVQALYVRCHRCGFYGPPEYEALSKPLTAVKASLRIAGADWIDVTDASVLVDADAAALGGIDGGAATLGFHVAIDEATRARLVASPARNSIEFRFNGSDGISNGYRVLDVQLQDAAGNDLSLGKRRWSDIADEKLAPVDADASAAGAILWRARDRLQKSPLVARTLRAACSDCHAEDGRDLQYFNYSNHAIVQRSRFYGLSEAEGESIAASLRDSLAAVPHVPAAAPWNPPFQPGLGLDAQPANEWAAGAGLSAVLSDGTSFARAFVGTRDVTQSAISAALDPSGTRNTRELPLPLALPDWAAWLPTEHPLDIWSSGLFENGYQGKTPLAAYATLQAWFAEHTTNDLSAEQRNELQGLLQRLGAQVLGFGGGGQGSRVSSDPAQPFGGELGGKTLAARLAPETAALADLSRCDPAQSCTPFSAESFIERALVGLYHWMAVKQWELVETHGLQAQADFHGSVDAQGAWQGEGEARGWPYSWPSVHTLAPRTLFTPQSGRSAYFAWENRLASTYRTNQWDALQVVLNPGWAGASNGPVDWPSQLGSIAALIDRLNEAGAPDLAALQAMRWFVHAGKLSQLANTDLPFDAPSKSQPTSLFANAGMQSKADLLFKLSPAQLLDSDSKTPSRFRALDRITPGLYLSFVNASLASYLALFAETTRDQYRVCDPNDLQLGGPEPFAGMRFCIDAGRTPLPLGKDGQPYCPYPVGNGFTTAQYSVWGAGAARDLGADAGLVGRWSEWNDRIWPN